MRRAAHEVLDGKRLEELSRGKLRTKDAAINAALWASDMITPPLPNVPVRVAEAVQQSSGNARVPYLFESRNPHEVNDGPGLTNQTQPGLTPLTEAPARATVSSLNENENPDSPHPRELAEDVLDVRLAMPTDQEPPVRRSNSAEA